MEARAYIGWETPVARGGPCRSWGATGPRRPWGGDRPLSPVGGGVDRPPLSPAGGATCPLPRPGISLQIKKNYIRVLSPVAWATGPLSPLGRATGVFSKIFKTDIYF